jgi:hypothetical protein
MCDRCDRVHVHVLRGAAVLPSEVVLAAVVLLVVALPPPLCRGKVYDRYDIRQDKPGAPRAIAEVQTAYELLCPDKTCGVGQLYQNPTIGNNAVTWVSGLRDGMRTRAKIVYSAQFLDALSSTFGPGASFGVLAHEVGHHLTAAKGLRDQFEAAWNEELRADYLAGCALGRSGRPPVELENALRALATVATPSHPAFDMRTQVVRKGYADCKQNVPAGQGGGFGIGAALRAQAKQDGCWSYRYRRKDEIARVGPIAAKRIGSRMFTDRESCEAHRARLEPIERNASDECSCE